MPCFQSADATSGVGRACVIVPLLTELGATFCCVAINMSRLRRLNLMIDRVLKNKGFFEWYDVKTGEPNGSGDFQGEAGVLYDVIRQLRAWANNRH